MKKSPTRRRVLGMLVFAAAGVSGVAAGWMWPLQAMAARWNKAAFEARALADAMRSIGASDAAESGQIRLTTPEIAENSSIVPVEITSEIPGTQTIFIIADKNPQPLTAIFDITGGLEPFVSTRIKMSESSKVTVVVKANGMFYVTAREVKVTDGGCGG
jgi:sulfur-oxidizing protein SoxY